MIFLWAGPHLKTKQETGLGHAYWKRSHSSPHTCHLPPRTSFSRCSRPAFYRGRLQSSIQQCNKESDNASGLKLLTSPTCLLDQEDVSEYANRSITCFSGVLKVCCPLPRSAGPVQGRRSSTKGCWAGASQVAARLATFAESPKTDLQILAQS